MATMPFFLGADGDYTDEPYIALPSGIINAIGDVSIEIWVRPSRAAEHAGAVPWLRQHAERNEDPHVLWWDGDNQPATDGFHTAAQGMADDASPGTGDFQNPVRR